MIWKSKFTLASLDETSRNTMVSHLGIEFTGFGDSHLQARMPVDHRTVQPARILHGGASVALAETLGSVASYLCIEDRQRFQPVGVEINANHLRPATMGYVTGTVKPVRIGRRLHVWNIEIEDEDGRLTCVSRITIAIVERPGL